MKGDAPYKIPKLKGEDAVDRDPRDDVDDDDDKVKKAAGHEVKGDGKFVGKVPDDKEHDEEKRR